MCAYIYIHRYVGSCIINSRAWGVQESDSPTPLKAVPISTLKAEDEKVIVEFRLHGLLEAFEYRDEHVMQALVLDTIKTRGNRQCGRRSSRLPPFNFWVGDKLKPWSLLVFLGNAMCPLS